MEKIVRFGVSIEPELLERFDALIHAEGYGNRSEAIRDLIRKRLVEAETEEGRGTVAATITFLYDHHSSDLVNSLISIQHEAPVDIKASTHVHLTHDLCMEVISCIGEAREARRLGDRIKSLRGVLFAETVYTTPEVFGKEPHKH
ncbi:MAG: nickel-responsive transcriptional regulator NikR [Thermoplasmata archaeon]|nr:nickel-responsive transcriptional regulator NikR [Thermoplasmata archaeon]